MGCATHRTLELDAQHPPFSVTTLGVKFGDELVRPEEAAGILESYDVPHDRVIYIRLDPDVIRDLKTPSSAILRMSLSRAGYTRTIFVTERHAESENLGKPKKTAVTSTAVQSAPRRVIRYKRAGE